MKVSLPFNKGQGMLMLSETEEAEFYSDASNLWLINSWYVVICPKDLPVFVATVLAIQTFGDYLNFHPHLHLLVADGLFTPSGLFYCMPRCNLKALEELFSEYSLLWLV